MSDSKKGDQEPNLELPSLLGFGRKRKRGRAQPAPTAAPTTSAPEADSAPAAPTTAEHGTARPDAQPASGPASGPPSGPVTPPRSGLAPATGAARRVPPMPPPPARASGPSGAVSPPEQTTRPETAAATPAAAEPAAVAPVLPRPTPAPTTPAPSPTPAPTRSPEPAAPEPVPAPEPVIERAPTPEPSPVPEPSQISEPSQIPEPSPVSKPEPTPGPTDVPAANDATTVTTTDHSDDTAAREATDGDVHATDAEKTESRPRRELPSLTLPVLNHWLATAIAGVLAGLVGVAVVFLAQQGCELVRGVGSCGGGIGVIGLLLVLAAAVVVGATLLRLLHVSDATSTSLLGVGMLAVIVLLFLLGATDSAWMVLVVPVLTALTFLLAHWVTGTFVESVEDRPADFR